MDLVSDSLPVQMAIGLITGVAAIVISSLLPTPGPAKVDDGDAKETDPPVSEQQQEEVVNAFRERRRRLKKAGVDVEKIQRLIDEFEEESKRGLQVPTWFLKLVQALFYSIPFVVAGVLILKSGLPLKDFFYKELAFLQGTPGQFDD